MEEEAMTVAEWIEAYGRAWRERDADAAAALFIDAVYRAHPPREPHRGREGIHAYWSGATSKQATSICASVRPSSRASEQPSSGGHRCRATAKT